MLLGATFAWSTSGLFARAITVDTPTLIRWRGLAGAAGLLVVLWWLKGAAGFRDFLRLGRAGWAYALFSGLAMLLFVGSLRNTSVAHVAIIYATLPFVAAVLGWLILKEPPGRAGIPRFGTSFRLCGPLVAFSAAGSNPLALGNGFSPAKAGFPVFACGMICRCV